MQQFQDDKGNHYTNDSGNLKIYLPKGEVRNIGYLTTESDKIVYICNRDKRKHLMKVNSSYGVNDFVIRTFKPDIIRIIILDEGITVEVDTATFNDNSTFMHFKNQGFELQRFIETKYLKKV